MSESKCFIKSVDLHPTGFSLDIFVAKTYDGMKAEIMKRYSLNEKDAEYYIETESWAGYINHPKLGTRLVVSIQENGHPKLIAHEAYHLLRLLCRLTKSTMSVIAEEWQAMQHEYIFGLIYDAIEADKKRNAK